MPSTLAQLEAEAMHRPVERRARLAQRLIASLDELGEAEAERLWSEEAERRFDGYRIEANATNTAIRLPF